MMTFDEGELILVQYYEDDIPALLRYRIKDTQDDFVFDCYHRPGVVYVIMQTEIDKGLVKILSRGQNLELLYGNDRKFL